MPITASDIKLLSSARMTDAADSGGRMTTTPIQDGVLNTLFPNLDSIDRALGAMQWRKVYQAVLAAGTDPLLGAHMVINDGPDDPAVSAVLVPAASLTEELSGLVARLNASPLGIGYHGIAKLTSAANSGDATLEVDSTRVPIIPGSRTSSSVSGSLAPSGSSAETVTGYILTDASYTFSGTGYLGIGAMDLEDIGAPNYKVRLKPRLPLQTTKTTITSGNRSDAYYFSIPAGTVPGSESVRVWVNAQMYVLRAKAHGAGGDFTLVGILPRDPYVNPQGVTGGYAGDIPGTALSLPSGLGCFVDRAAGSITLTLHGLPDVGSEIVVGFAAGGTTGAQTDTSHLSSATFSGGQVTVSTTAGRQAMCMAFKLDTGAWVGCRGSVVLDHLGVSVGAYNQATGVLTMPSADGHTITVWRAIEADIAAGVSSASAALPASLDPSTLTITGTTSAGAGFSATADALGVFSSGGVTGAYDDVTGAISLVFAAPVRSNTLAWTANQFDYLPSTGLPPGLNASLFPSSGEVPGFAKGDVAVLQHIAETSPETVIVGSVMSCGRTDIAWAFVIGNDGKIVTTGGYTVNKAAGTVTVTSATGWAQPVHLRHAIEHTAGVAANPTRGSVVINRAVTRTFPVGSVVSGALLLGDLQAAVGAAFSQETWTDVWSDSRIGVPITAQYDDVGHPIQVDGLGAVTQRWAFIFTTSTAFRCIGEFLGEVATGSKNSDFAPINPATGYPFFTILATGWGGGWSAGNVLRFNTGGANAPGWVGRITQPSTPGGADSITLAGRGDLNA